MDLLELMQIISKAYDADNVMANYFSPVTGEPIRYKLNTRLLHDGMPEMVAIPAAGDTLAAFIVSEVNDLTLHNQSDVDIDEVIRGLNSAQRQLQNIVDALEENYE